MLFLIPSFFKIFPLCEYIIILAYPFQLFLLTCCTLLFVYAYELSICVDRLLPSFALLFNLLSLCSFLPSLTFPLSHPVLSRIPLSPLRWLC